MQFVDPICEDSSNATLQEALDDAGGTAVDDTIHIGPVPIMENGPEFQEGLSYTSTTAENDVTLVGQGADQTTIQHNDSLEYPTFTTSANSHVTVEDLGFFIVGNAAADAFNGVRVLGGGAALTRVRVTAQDSAFNHAFNSGVRLVLASGPLTMTDSTINGADNDNAECLASSAFETPIVTGTEFTDCDFGVRAIAASAPSVDRSTFTSGRFGAQVEGSAGISINRSSFVDGGGGIYAVVVLDDGRFRLDNSLVLSDFGAIRMRADDPGDEASGTVNQSTLVGSGVAVAVSTSAEEATPWGGDGDSAHIEIHDTIITGYQQVSLAAFGGTMTSDYSFYDFGNGNHTGGTNDIDSVGDTVASGFVDPPNDYSLAATSILRDKDPLTTPRPGFGPVPAEVITTDLALNPRIDNGARDIGAYEFQFVPPDPVTTTPAATPTGKRAAALKKCKKKKSKKARANCRKKAKKLPL